MASRPAQARGRSTGRCKLTIAATAIGGDRSQIIVPFDDVIAL